MLCRTTYTPRILLRVEAFIGAFMYTQGRSSHLPIPSLRFSCYELGPVFALTVFTAGPAARRDSQQRVAALHHALYVHDVRL
jgi:hypothetical protein